MESWFSCGLHPSSPSPASSALPLLHQSCRPLCRHFRTDKAQLQEEEDVSQKESVPRCEVLGIPRMPMEKCKIYAISSLVTQGQPCKWCRGDPEIHQVPAHLLSLEGRDRSACSCSDYKSSLTYFLNLLRVMVEKEAENKQKNPSHHLWNLHLEPWRLVGKENKLGAGWHWNRAKGRINLSNTCKYIGEEISLHLILGSACLMPPVN